MKRYADERPLLARRAAQWRALSSDACDVEPGRFRKRKPLDCGRARCQVCHCDKLFGHQHVSRQRFCEAADDALRQLSQG
jgi:hypothetical protein